MSIPKQNSRPTHSPCWAHGLLGLLTSPTIHGSPPSPLKVGCPQPSPQKSYTGRTASPQLPVPSWCSPLTPVLAVYNSSEAESPLTGFFSLTYTPPSDHCNQTLPHDPGLKSLNPLILGKKPTLRLVQIPKFCFSDPCLSWNL